MRRTAGVIVAAGIVAAAGLALAAWCAAARGEAPSVVTKIRRFDVMAGDAKVGSVRFKTLIISDVVILDEEFSYPEKDAQAHFDSQIVYKGADKPVPQRGTGATRVGAMKLMSGKVEFAADDDGLRATISAEGYATKERKPLAQASTAEKELVLPSDLALTRSAVLHFATQLLPKPGTLQNVTLLELPDNPDFPDLLAAKGGYELVRASPDEKGNSLFTLRLVFAGGNPSNLLKMTVDAQGEIVEVAYPKFTMKALPPDALPEIPDADAPAPVPVPPPAKGKSPSRPGR
jgi:hypothetical protein